MTSLPIVPSFDGSVEARVNRRNLDASGHRWIPLQGPSVLLQRPTAILAWTHDPPKPSPRAPSRDTEAFPLRLTSSERMALKAVERGHEINPRRRRQTASDALPRHS
jgi:hypothetical protein